MAKYSIRNFLDHEVRGSRAAVVDAADDLGAIAEATKMAYAAQAFRRAPVRYTITRDEVVEVATLHIGRHGTVQVDFPR